MTVAERIDGYLRCGLDLFLGTDDRLRVRGALWLREVARPSLAMRRDELIAELKCQRAEATRRLTARRAGVPRLHLVDSASISINPSLDLSGENPSELA